MNIFQIIKAAGSLIGVGKHVPFDCDTLNENHLFGVGIKRVPGILYSAWFSLKCKIATDPSIWDIWSVISVVQKHSAPGHVPCLRGLETENEYEICFTSYSNQFSTLG